MPTISRSLEGIGTTHTHTHTHLHTLNIIMLKCILDVLGKMT